MIGETNKCEDVAGVGRFEVAAFVLAVLTGGIVVAAFAAADSSHGGDYTWRNQAALGVLRIPVYIGGLAIVALMALSVYRHRGDGRMLRWRLAGLISMMAGGLLAVICIWPIDTALLRWDANVPPVGWEALRERRATGYVICLGLGLVGFVPLVICSCFARVKR